MECKLYVAAWVIGKGEKEHQVARDGGGGRRYLGVGEEMKGRRDTKEKILASCYSKSLLCCMGASKGCPD